MNHMTSVGVVTIVVLGLLTLLAPALWPHSPYAQNAELIFQSPSVRHWFGTDESGRDLFARASLATGISLAIGLLSVVIGALLGIPFGTVSAYSGGRPDLLMQRAVDIFMSFPLLIRGLMIIAAVG